MDFIPFRTDDVYLNDTNVPSNHDLEFHHNPVISAEIFATSQFYSCTPNYSNIQDLSDIGLPLTYRLWGP